MNDQPFNPLPIHTKEPESHAAKSGGKTGRTLTYRMVPIGPTEQIRKDLGLSESQFSVALGYSDSWYHMAAGNGKISMTAALAAECLKRRQGRDPGDQFYLVHMVKGMAQIVPIRDVKEMLLDNQTYWLVPQSTRKDHK